MSFFDRFPRQRTFETQQQPPQAQPRDNSFQAAPEQVAPQQGGFFGALRSPAPRGLALGQQPQQQPTPGQPAPGPYSQGLMQRAGNRFGQMMRQRFGGPPALGLRRQDELQGVQQNQPQGQFPPSQPKAPRPMGPMDRTRRL